MHKLLGTTPIGLLILLFLVFKPQSGLAQVEEARQAIADGNHLEAIEILTPAQSENPSADVYLYLGLAHANLLQYERALEVFNDGAVRYPNDARFHSETAGVHLASRDITAAVEALNLALEVDPTNAYASDLLASIRLSEADVEAALDTWNGVGRPEIDRILENFSPGFLNQSVPRALTFGPGDVLTYEKWKTTRERLFASKLFSNVGLDVEPSGPEDLYNAIVQTSNKGNSPRAFFVRMIRELPVETVHLDLWNVGFSGISWQSNFRWDEDRRRLQGLVTLPLPLRSLPILELGNTWRSERWDLVPSIRDEFQSDARFDYKVNAMTIGLKVIPTHQVELSLGFDYRNRDVLGTMSRLGMDSRNSGTVEVGMVLRPFDGRYKNQIRVEGFLARRSLIGDFDFTGGSVAVRNRIVIDRRGRALFDWSVSGGTSRGELPVDHYFILGLGDITDHRLRGHVAHNGGQYGRAPMGTDFVLVNTDIQYRLFTIPLFNTLDIPFIQVKAMGFFDSAKTFDRQRIFRQGHWLNDLGGGLRFETPTTSFTVLYGRNINGEENNLYGYVERRIW